MATDRRATATAPKPNKVTAIRTARDKVQALARLKIDAKTLCLYGVPVNQVIATIHAGYAEGTAQMD